MEAFEHVVKVFLEAKGYVVTTGVKFPVRRRTRKAKYAEYQTHGYEMDVVGARHGSLMLGSVKSFFGSPGVSRQDFKGIADPRKKTHFERYAVFNEPEIREGVLKQAVERYGYPADCVRLSLFVGNFVRGDRKAVTDHLRSINVGVGTVEVYDLRTIVEGLLGVVQSKTYYNDAVVITLKALKEAGLSLELPTG